MSTTADDTDDTTTGVEQIDEDTLVPIRVRGGNRLCIGNEEEALTKSSGYTRYLIYATAHSVLHCDNVAESDRRVLSTLMDSGLDFESYTAEATNRLGRPAVQIVVEEGEEAYDELRSEFDDNDYLYAAVNYLHAAVKGVSVYEAAQELDVTPILAFVQDGEMVESIGGGWSDPDLVAGATEVDGEIVEVDLREFTPDLEFVVENWSDLGGSRRNIIVRRGSDDDEKTEFLLGISRDDPEAATEDVILNFDDRSCTAHGIREVEEAIVDDVEDRYRSYCGMVEKRVSRTTSLEVEAESVEDMLCSLCEQSMTL